MDLWNQQPRDGCTESEVTRPLGAPGCRDHRGLRVQTPADGWGNPGHGVSLPPGAPLICILHSSILLFIHFTHSANMYSMPMRCQALSRTWGPRGELGGGHCPCPVLGASRAARVPSASPISEQVREHDQAWVQVWECPRLRAEDVGQGHFLEEPDDDIVRGRLGRRAARGGDPAVRLGLLLHLLEPQFPHL